jgi:hypothetical protein
MDMDEAMRHLRKYGEVRTTPVGRESHYAWTQLFTVMAPREGAAGNDDLSKQIIVSPQSKATPYLTVYGTELGGRTKVAGLTYFYVGEVNLGALPKPTESYLATRGRANGGPDPLQVFATERGYDLPYMLDTGDYCGGGTFHWEVRPPKIDPTEIDVLHCEGRRPTTPFLYFNKRFSGSSSVNLRDGRILRNQQNEGLPR